MQALKHEASWAGVLVVLLVAVGCGGDIPVYPVHGKITFEEKPLLGGGSIALVPLGDQPGKTAGGEIAADGTYRLSTHRQDDGSMVGEFRVVIYQVVEQEAPERSGDEERASKPITVVPEADRIPAIYSDHQKSPLRATVEARDSNEINFDLKRNP